MAQCLSTIHFSSLLFSGIVVSAPFLSSILLWDEYFMLYMSTLLLSITPYLILIELKNNFVHQWVSYPIENLWKLVSLCISCSLCWGYHLYLSAHESSTHKAWWELKLTKLYRECLAAARALAGKVIITCTQLPLPSHWSRSPGSCPCSLPAPGHIRRSPYKCSHTSHRQSLLAPLRTELLKKQIQETAFFTAFVMLCPLTSYK